MTSNFFDKWLRRVFLLSLALTTVAVPFAYGALAAWKNLPPIPQIKRIYRTMTTLGHPDVISGPVYHHLQPSRGQGEGVTVNSLPDDRALVLMTGFFEGENQARLIKRDGTIVRKWSLDYFKHYPDPATRVCEMGSPLRVDIHGAYVTSLGELVFNYEYCGLVKLDQCGELMWRHSKPAHHSLVPSEAGGYWLLGRYEWLASENPDRLPPFSSPATNDPIAEDTLLRVSEDGQVLEEFSFPQLLIDNGLEALLTANGDGFGLEAVKQQEVMHTNKAAELPSAIASTFPLFEAGDLAVSVREYNLVVVFDPVSKKVKWHQTGPWLRQHDPEFRDDGRISIFNNNTYRTAYEHERTILSTPFTTNIIAVDPVSRETEVIFGEQLGEEMLSVIRGEHQLLENGGMLITEFDAGRVLEVNADGQIVWEYVNLYNDDFVGEITNSALFPADYFQGELRSCG